MNARRCGSTLCALAMAVLASGCCCFQSAPCGAPVCSDCVGGRSYAFETYDGCCEGGAPVCVCTGPCECGPTCGCEPGCAVEPGCACEPGCALEPGCAIEPECGCEPCGAACGCGDCVAGEECCAWYTLKHAYHKLFSCLCGCSGCAGEVYWDEWHNDPPRCCDPCDRCGNWVGPSTAYRAPYDHPMPVVK